MEDSNITKTGNTLLDDLKRIIEQGRQQAYQVGAQIAALTYWQLGQRIVQQEQNGEVRAQYGARLLKTLSEQLTLAFGNGFSKRNLEYARKVYLAFPRIEIVQTRLRNLSWSHLCLLSSVANPQARQWYSQEASEQMWSVRLLDRNISTQYYERTLAAQKENLQLPQDGEGEDAAPLEYIKNPLVAEFLGFRKDTKFDESRLEQALIDHLQQFIMELGRGFAFVDRQKHIYAGGDDYYIDLVFYNIHLHCYFIIYLKTHKLSHQDIGQLDMYVSM